MCFTPCARASRSVCNVCSVCVCVCCSGGSWFSAPGQCPIKEKVRERQCVKEREERGSSFRQQERRAVFHLQPTNRQIDRQTVGPGLGRPPICPLLIHLLSSGCHMEPHTKLMESPSSALLFYDYFFLTSLASFPPFILPSCALA